jgi:MtfA peptidase
MSGFYRKWKRRRLLTREFPATWDNILHQHVPFYERLPPKLQPSFRDFLKVFLFEKRFFGAGGLEMNDLIRLVISASAIRLILRLDLSYYDHLAEIVVYPFSFVRPKDNHILLGEAHSFGTVVLSWPAVLHGIAHPCDGNETAIHEFAHILDRGNGWFDGTPVLRDPSHYDSWDRVFTRHFRALQEGSLRELSVLREYGATNEAEFFAVATESFFEKPKLMKELLPDLYEEMERFYGFDSAADSSC